MADDHGQEGTTVIPDRFCGPSTSANGGYACGVAAELLGARLGVVEPVIADVAGDHAAAAVEVTLHHPPPLAQPLRTSIDQDTLALYDHQTVVLTARRATLEPTQVSPVLLREAYLAAESFDIAAYRGRHPFPTCFTCGPARDEGDGLRIFPAPVDGREHLVAWPWTPPASTADDHGLVTVPIIWAALDCPSGSARFAYGTEESMSSVLGRMTAAVHARPAAGQELVVGGWTVSEKGRKALAASAVWSAEGEVLAESHTVWINLDEHQRARFGVVS